MKRILCLIILIIITGCTSLEPVNYTKKSYNSSGKIDIRGSKQYIKIKSENIDNPVLLYLHGGPGISYTPIINYYLDDLKEEFTFVMWDQRGTGKSDDGDVPYEFWTIDNMVEDANEVTKYLKEKFGKEKIFIIGSSWGSVLGMELINKYPQNYYAYIGTGQAVNLRKNYMESYDLLYDKSIKAGNKRRVKKLEKIGRPDGTFSQSDSVEEYQKYLMYKTKHSSNLNWIDSEISANLVMYSKNYNPLIQKWKRLKMERLIYEDLMNIDLIYQIPKVDIPIYFAVGREDLHTPYTLVEDYYESIQAPYKELVWFEKSAHGPEIQEPEKFIELMRRVKNENIENKVLYEN